MLLFITQSTNVQLCSGSSFRSRDFIKQDLKASRGEHGRCLKKNKDKVLPQKHSVIVVILQTDRCMESCYLVHTILSVAAVLNLQQVNFFTLINSYATYNFTKL